MESLYIIPYVLLLGVGLLAVSGHIPRRDRQAGPRGGALIVPLPIGLWVVVCGLAGIALAVAGLNGGIASAITLLGVGGWAIATAVPGRFREAHIDRGMRPVPLLIAVLITLAGIGHFVMLWFW